MSPLAALVTTAAALALVVAYPLLGRARNRELVDPATTAARRRAIQRGSVVRKWASAAVALVLCRWAGFELRWWPASLLGWLLTAGLLVGIAGGTVMVRRQLRDPELRREAMTAADRVRGILPRDAGERSWFAVVAVTAGVTEEVVFRGFLIPYVEWLLPGDGGTVTVVAAAVVAGVGFGVSHLYQGAVGVALTAAIGIALGLLYPLLGLAALVAVHAVFDLRLLALPILPGDGAEPAT